MEELKSQLSSKEKLISTLQESIHLKDEQIKTLKDSLGLKDDQIKILENSISVKEDKIITIEKTLKLKEEELKSLLDSPVDKEELEKRDKKIEELQNKLEVLNEELKIADEDLETLEAENEKLRAASSASTDSKIIDFTNREISQAEIIDYSRGILQNALHNVMIVVPTILDLQDLYIYEVRSSVNVQISCLIDPGIEEHTELLDELESLENVSLRLYTSEDRIAINRDNEELLLAVKGNQEENYLVFHTSDAKHVGLFQSLIMESWLRARKVDF